jgi:hypothetical protein
MFFVFVLFVALVATLGSDFLPMTNDVPIFIRDIPPRFVSLWFRIDGDTEAAKPRAIPESDSMRFELGKIKRTRPSRFQQCSSRARPNMTDHSNSRSYICQKRVVTE